MAKNERQRDLETDFRQLFKTETEKCDSVVCCAITREEFWLILSAASITEEEENSLC